MNEDQVISYLVGLDGVETTTHEGNTFFFSGSEHKFPFATLVHNNAYDTVSDLDRPSVFRLNIGLKKQTFQSLFGVAQRANGTSEDADEAADAEPNYDFAALDQIMPHPVYRRQYWVSVLNPSDQTFETQVRPLIAEAYEMDLAKQIRKQG